MSDADIIHIEPLTFSWSEWLPRVRSCYPRMKVALDAGGPIAAARAIGDWQKETDEWMRTFDEGRRRSVVDLLLAETDMLYETIDPSDGRKPEHGGIEFSDFRQRYYEAIPLALAAQRLSFERSSFAVESLRRVEAFAEQKNWLP